MLSSGKGNGKILMKISRENVQLSNRNSLSTRIKKRELKTRFKIITIGLQNYCKWKCMVL